MFNTGTLGWSCSSTLRAEFPSRSKYQQLIPLCSLVLISTYSIVFSATHFPLWLFVRLLKSLFISSSFPSTCVRVRKRETKTVPEIPSKCASMWHAGHNWSFPTFRNSSLFAHDFVMSHLYVPPSPSQFLKFMFSGKQQRTCVITSQSHRGKQRVSSQRGRETLLCRLGNYPPHWEDMSAWLMSAWQCYPVEHAVCAHGWAHAYLYM